MKNRFKVFAIVAILSLLGVLFLLCTMISVKGSELEIYEIADIEYFSALHNINMLDINDIYYYNLSDTSVLIVDNRNAEKSLYIHSVVTAELNGDGTLKVVVIDKAAVSEADISGKYAVLIDGKNKILNVQIKKEE